MELMSYRIVTVRKDNSIKLMRKLLTNVAAVPRLPKKITLARNVFAMVNEDKKHQLHDKRENLKRCEIKQLPNCWPGKPFKVSRFSLHFLLFPSFFSPLESSFVSEMRRFLSLFSQRVVTSPDHLPREILALPSQFTLSLPQLAATSLTCPWTPLDALLFLHPLPFSYPLCARYVPERI